MTSIASGILSARERKWAEKVAIFLRSPEGQDLLPRHARGWSDGGCDELAAAFHILLGTRAQLYGIQSAGLILEHFVTRIRGTDFFLDERGAYDAHETEFFWTEEMIDWHADPGEFATLVEVSSNELRHWRNEYNPSCDTDLIRRIAAAIKREAGKF